MADGEYPGPKLDALRRQNLEDAGKSPLDQASSWAEKGNPGLAIDYLNLDEGIPEETRRMLLARAYEIHADNLQKLVGGLPDSEGKRLFIRDIEERRDKAAALRQSA